VKLSLAVTFLLTAGVLCLLLSLRVAAWFLDQPNERSLHASPVPRTGGLAIVPAVALGLLMAGADRLLVVLAVALMLLSLLDDWRRLPAGWRLLGHLAAAAVFAWARFPGAGWLELVLLALAVGWMINLYNFMDGADGLAGGMTVIGFCAYAVAAAIAANASYTVASLCVASAAFAFLLFNFPPARIFMGDAGSIPLGFLAAAFGALGWRDGLWPLCFPLVVFAPFVLDASVTLLKRGLRGERVWQAHRSHYYQRLVLGGWSHRRLAISEYALMLLGSGAALLALHRSAAMQMVIVASLAVIYLSAGLTIDRRWREGRTASGGE